MTDKTTKEQFEADYALGGGLTVERLHSLGLVAAPCDCDYEHCRGWQMETVMVDRH